MMNKYSESLCETSITSTISANSISDDAKDNYSGITSGYTGEANEKTANKPWVTPIIDVSTHLSATTPSDKHPEVVEESSIVQENIDYLSGEKVKVKRYFLKKG